jgi:hypothetical protein
VTAPSAGPPPGAAALGASAFSCRRYTNLANGGSLSGDAGSYAPGVSFGSPGVSYANGTTFVLQPGIYLVHLSADSVALSSTSVDQQIVLLVDMWLNNTLVGTIAGNGYYPGGPVPYVQVAGDELLRVSAANTTFAFLVELLEPVSGGSIQNDCRIIFTRLQ